MCSWFGFRPIIDVFGRFGHCTRRRQCIACRLPARLDTRQCGHVTEQQCLKFMRLDVGDKPARLATGRGHHIGVQGLLQYIQTPC